MHPGGSHPNTIASPALRLAILVSYEVFTLLYQQADYKYILLSRRGFPGREGNTYRGKTRGTLF
jgi:hypothetical protein